MAVLGESPFWDSVFILFLIPYFLIIHISGITCMYFACAKGMRQFQNHAIFSFSVSVLYWLLALTLLPVARQDSYTWLSRVFQHTKYISKSEYRFAVMFALMSRVR